MALTISVTPAGDGWAVRSQSFENEMVFRAGAKAEAAAHAFARQLAESGRAALVEVFLRDGALAGRFEHKPSAAEAA